MWTQRYAERAIGMQHPEAQDMYPRYNVLAAILVDVESLVPGEFDTVEAARSTLVMAGQTASDIFTRPPQSDIAERAMDDERRLFCHYVQGLTATALRAVAPLPFLGSLSQAEHTRLWARLQERWGPRHGDYWYPLDGEDPPEHVLALQAAWFEHAVPSTLLQELLQQHGVGHIWELREFGPEYELDLALLNPFYNGAEGYWTADDMAWLLYASHESSITVAGAWLVTALKNVWPDWQEHMYTDPHYAPPAGT